MIYIIHLWIVKYIKDEIAGWIFYVKYMHQLTTEKDMKKKITYKINLKILKKYFMLELVWWSIYLIKISLLIDKHIMSNKNYDCSAQFIFFIDKILLVLVEDKMIVLL